jgi:hypothetical protein
LRNTATEFSLVLDDDNDDDYDYSGIMISRRNGIKKLSGKLAVMPLSPPRISHETAQNCIRGYAMGSQSFTALAYVQIKRLQQRQLLRLPCVAYSINGVVRCKSKRIGDNGQKFEMDALLFK